MFEIIAGILLFTNLTAFLLMGVDKHRAVKKRWRIPERVLLLACVPFSAAGGLLGMKLFHHKTLKPLFRFGVPAMLTAQIIIVIALCRRLL